MIMEEKQDLENVDTVTSEEEGQLPEEPKQPVRRRPDFQRTNTVCSSCQ